MIGPRIKSHLERLGMPVFRRIHHWGISPNTVTLIGLAINLIASLLLLAGHFTAGGVLILTAGLCDMLDGGVARIRGGEDRFGAFWDSIIDRCSDLFLLMGVLLHYARTGQVELVGLSCLAILGTVLIPYARARAECFLPQCSVGWMERPERILLLAVGAIFHVMPFALGLLALLTHVTVFQRVHYCWKHLSSNSPSPSGEGELP
jgi:CDP-diacylglycerol--glycerol-3-phosphate 3-phosphatidyltransferase